MAWASAADLGDLNCPLNRAGGNAETRYNWEANAKSTFGETSVSASGPDPDDLSAFATFRASDGALTIMIVAKTLTGSTGNSESGELFPGRFCTTLAARFG